MVMRRRCECYDLWGENLDRWGRTTKHQRLKTKMKILDDMHGRKQGGKASETAGQESDKETDNNGAHGQRPTRLPTTAESIYRKEEIN